MEHNPWSTTPAPVLGKTTGTSQNNQNQRPQWKEIPQALLSMKLEAADLPHPKRSMVTLP